MARRSAMVPPPAHVRLDLLAATPDRLALEQRDQRAQRRLGVADQVDLVRVAHPDPLARPVDLHGPRLVELGQELRVREVRTDRQQRVAVASSLARGGTQQPDGAGDPGQVVGQDVLAEQRLGHARAERRRPPRSALSTHPRAPCPTSIATLLARVDDVRGAPAALPRSGPRRRGHARGWTAPA